MKKTTDRESWWSAQKTLERILSAKKSSLGEIEIKIDPQADSRAILDSIRMEVVGTGSYYFLREVCYKKHDHEKNLLRCRVSKEDFTRAFLLKFFTIVNGRTVSIEIPV